MCELKRISEFVKFVEGESFPCVGAKAAMVQGAVATRTYGQLGSDADATSLHLDLQEYVAGLNINDPRVQSFAAIFEEPANLSETEFEKCLWDTLSALNRCDRDFSFDWNDQVSSDPGSAEFSLSVAGHPFFVVGMHPGASRTARRTPRPTLVFNSHIQFEALRADGRYDQLKKVIRKNDRELNGSINPMLDDFGARSEARQYSGRELPDDWKCPFHSVT